MNLEAFNVSTLTKVHSYHIERENSMGGKTPFSKANFFWEQYPDKAQEIQNLQTEIEDLKAHEARLDDQIATLERQIEQYRIGD